jgi:hypothetical protein
VIATTNQADLGVTSASIAVRRLLASGEKPVELLLVSNRDGGSDDGASTSIPFGGTLSITGVCETSREPLEPHPALPQLMSGEVVHRLEAACARFQTQLAEHQAKVSMFSDRIGLCKWG